MKYQVEHPHNPNLAQANKFPSPIRVFPQGGMELLNMAVLQASV
jgi:hypothetical protein